MNRSATTQPHVMLGFNLLMALSSVLAASVNQEHGKARTPHSKNACSSQRAAVEHTLSILSRMCERVSPVLLDHYKTQQRIATASAPQRSRAHQELPSANWSILVLANHKGAAVVERAMLTVLISFAMAPSQTIRKRTVAASAVSLIR
jgi:hypothetical protein